MSESATLAGGTEQGVHAGRAWKFGDSVDTNQLAGGGLVGKTRAETLRINCLRGLRPDFTESVQEGDILVVGENFGAGSARQSAVEALQLCGISYVLAESVARIHRRNSVALALPTMVVRGITQLAEDGDRLEVDETAGVVRNLTRGGELPLPETPESVKEIYRAGGMLKVIAQKLAEQGIVPPAE
jgi:3-isopropylmalate/(R)-2-methylmalate dehydratase small subunit